MSLLLEGKSMLITGASKGIGKAIALIAAQNGADLVLLARNKILLDELEKEIKGKYPVQVYSYCCDVTREEDIKHVFQQLNTLNIQIDCVVNNAGVMKDAMLQVVKPELMREIYDTNVFAVMQISQLAMKSMLRKRKGSIINLTSIIGTNGNSGQVVYGSSKSAVIGITKSLAKELAPFNIRVNAVAPGFIDTDMTRNMDARFREKNMNSIGMKRIGQPDDVAKVILFLASDLSDYVTGQVIGVDGGMII
jgi:3-oxoacyl-[acyl-carrier protein] reductase